MSAALPASLPDAFGLPGPPLHAAPHGNGHIHATFVAGYARGGDVVRYLHQRLNTRVFRRPEALMQNIVRVTAHLRARLARGGVGDADRRCLSVVSARDGRPFHVAEDGSYWRTYRFIEGARSVERPADAAQAREAARAFGTFAALLADLPPPALAETIPGFHDLDGYFGALQRAARRDAHARAAHAHAELDAAARSFERVGDALRASGVADLPRRIAHNDCKLNNVLFDEGRGEALCVIDLDTVMAGSLLADFGDLVRTAASTAAEDERDLDAIDLDLERFEALAQGYRAGAGSLLGEAERSALPLAGAALSLENAVRFLADHLDGDRYFRVHRPGHNLDRARAQLRLAERMLARLPETRAAWERAAPTG